MYWFGHLAIDPSHLTTTRRKPTKGFRRFAELLTVGITSVKEEVETFTALSILQELNRVLRSLGVTDLVKFSKDDQVLYEDVESRDTDDVQQMLPLLDADQRTAGGGRFESLSLLLEHHLPDLALVIEVRIRRTHAVGIFPIQITVNGLAVEFQNNASDDELEGKLTETFATQDRYDEFQNHHREQFERFMNALELAVRQQMKIDDLHKVVRTKMVRPHSDRTDPDTTHSTTSDPVFARHDSMSDAFLYCWLWSQFAHANEIQIQDTTLVDDQGRDFASIAGSAVDAGQGDLFNPDVPLSESTLGSLEGGEISQPDGNKIWGAEASGDADSSSWLSGWGDLFDGGGGGDGGSGCGSGCGGGCGGGCGS